jgi:hypothetical protein
MLWRVEVKVVGVPGQDRSTTGKKLRGCWAFFGVSMVSASCGIDYLV